jgi:hypothetical protein
MRRFQSSWSAVRVLISFLTVNVLLLALVGVVAAQAPQGATLTVVSGTVGVVKANGSPLQPAPNGLTLAVGDQVATLANSTALVTFFEGSELEMAANTTVVLKEIRSSGNEVHVLVEDVLGTTIGRVRAFANPNSDFRLQNPGGQVVAIARGSTVFGHSAENSSAVYGFVECVRAPCKVQGPSISVERTGQAAIGCTPKGDCTELPIRGGNIFETVSNAVSDFEQKVEKERKEENPPPSEGGGYPGASSSPLISEMLRSRLGEEIDPFAATGSLLALGMIGWTFIGHRPRRR